MEDKYIVPIAAMLAGLGIWVVYLIVRALSSSVKAWPTQAETGLCLFAGGLIVFSGVR
jgi:ABC-type iron transport system FetAB permease component